MDKLVDRRDVPLGERITRWIESDTLLAGLVVFFLALSYLWFSFA